MIRSLCSAALLASLAWLEADATSTKCSAQYVRRSLKTNEEGVFQWSPWDLGCASSAYELSHYTDMHLYLVATPASLDGESNAMNDIELKKFTAASHCPILIFHSGEGNKKRAEEILIPLDQIEGDEQGPTPDFRFVSDRHPFLKGISLNDIVMAYELVDEDDETSDREWDVVGNNCATFIIHMKAHLGVYTDEETVAYQSQSMLAANHTIHHLRNNTNVEQVLGEGVLELDDYSLLHKLTTAYAEKEEDEFHKRYRM